MLAMRSRSFKIQNPIELRAYARIMHAWQAPTSISASRARNVRILTLLRFGRCPQLFPVMIVSGFFQGTKISQSFGRPKLSGSLETTLTLATS